MELCQIGAYTDNFGIGPGCFLGSKGQGPENGISAYKSCLYNAISPRAENSVKIGKFEDFRLDVLGGIVLL